MTQTLLDANDPGAIAEGARRLRNGELVAFPTETVYGLGANALDAEAVARIFTAKQRPYFDPLIVHIAAVADVARVAETVPEVAERLMEAFWPGPLTLLLPKHDRIPGIVTSGLRSVGVRLPSNEVARALISGAEVPVAAPSANPFGRLSPTTAEHVIAGLGENVDLVLDGGATDFGVESTIVDVSGITPRILRFGALSVESLQDVVGEIVIEGGSTVTGAPEGPGRLPQHYAPRTPIVFSDMPSPDVVPSRCAYVAFMSADALGRETAEWATTEVLSSSGDLAFAAARLFDVLHRLDREGFDRIVIERVPDHGIGRAINDRLRRAVATFS